MPFVDGKTIAGWGVVRSAPWHLQGVYSTKEEADAKAAQMGDGYSVHWGDNREGTDDFIWTGDGRS